MPNSTRRGFFLLSCSRLKVYVVNSQLYFYIKRKEFSRKNEQLKIRFYYAKRGAENLKIIVGAQRFCLYCRERTFARSRWYSSTLVRGRSYAHDNRLQCLIVAT